MSASIKWKVVKNDGKYLNVGAPSSFIDAMKSAFGNFPCRIGPSEVATLRGMAAASRDSAYERLIEAIEEDTTIEVWAEY